MVFKFLMVLGFLMVLMTSAFPAGTLAYLLFTWSIRAGRLTKTENHKGMRAELKAMKTSRKEKKSKTRNPVHNKWLKFGGGFYGIMALWTFLVVEMAEIFQFFMNFTGLMDMIQRISVELVIGFIINSIQNFVIAITWFVYWLDEIDDDMQLYWFGLAYGGYWVGMQLARRRGHVEKAVEG